MKLLGEDIAFVVCLAVAAALGRVFCNAVDVRLMAAFGRFERVDAGACWGIRGVDLVLCDAFAFACRAVSSQSAAHSLVTSPEVDGGGWCGVCRDERILSGATGAGGDKSFSLFA